MADSEHQAAQLISTGNPELDGILKGGLTPHRVYLVEGNPGAGKTTLGLQFLLEGVKQGQKGLYVTLSETKSELEAVAESHGWDLGDLAIHELVDTEESFDPDSQYTMFQPSEVELNSTTKAVLKQVDELKPRRVVFDSLSEMRLLAQSPLRYRRQILALKQFFVGRECTVILLDDKSSAVDDLQLQSLAHGVISLEQLFPEYGGQRRRLRIAKMRGVQYQGGYHDFSIERGGLAVYPRAIEGGGAAEILEERLDSGNQSLDSLLGDGIERGSSVLLMGPAGSGKSSLATLYALSAANRGERAAVFTFDESKERLLQRSNGLDMNLSGHLESGAIVLEQVDPGELSPGQFAARVRHSILPDESGRRATVLIIDSLNGYLNAMPEERFLSIQLHELLMYLESHGVVTFLVMVQHGMVGTVMNSPVDASYLADSVILFRYFESDGEIRRAISVLKKRSGDHERTIREYQLRSKGIQVGEPLRDFQGVLSGTPTYIGSQSDLVEKQQNHG